MNYLIKIFLVWLMIHFFMYNWVNFSMGFQFEPMWLWKEWMILLFVLIFIYNFAKSRYFWQFTTNKSVFALEITFVAMVVISLLISILINKISLGQFVLAFKYDFLGYMIFFLFYHLWFYLNKEFVEKIITFYLRFVKVLLVVALIWYSIIVVKPGFFKLFGYDRNANEWMLWQRPPVVYYTQMNHGYVRNQFLFERPITWWFFLIAFWPLFYVKFLRRKTLGNTWHRWWLFALNLILTFSRASWIAWIGELLLLGLLEYRRNIKLYLFKVVLPIVLVVWALAWLLFNDIVMRYFSNSWHIKLMASGYHMFMENPLFGKWAATAGPWSHQICASNPNTPICQEIAAINKEHEIPDMKWFNTENQYLQVLVEFGLIIFIMWIAIFTFMCIFGLYRYWISSKTQLKDPFLRVLIAMSVGMIGLWIEWMMLHSFIDRMVVYPIMLIYGLVFSIYIQSTTNVVEIIETTEKKKKKK